MENKTKLKVSILGIAISVISLAGIGLDSLTSDSKNRFLGRLKDVKIYLLEIIGKIKTSDDKVDVSLLAELEDFLNRVSSIIVDVEKTNKYKLFVKGIFSQNKELKKLKADVKEFEKKYQNRGI